MRRADKEITSSEEMLSVLSKCDVVRLAMNDAESGYPYILPLNFGMEQKEDGTLYLYFHGADKGKKYELLDKDPRVSFEADCDHELYSIREKGYCTMNYKSVIGRGVVDRVTEEGEKMRALTILTDKYHPERHFEFNPVSMPRTVVLRLRVESMTGKARIPKK